MAFDFEEWKTAIISMAQGMIKANDLLEASGLITPDLDEEAFDRMMQQIEDDIAAEERRSGKASPG